VKTPVATELEGPASATDAQPVGARVARGALALLSTQPLTWSTSLALAVFLPRYLGDTALGQYGVAWSLASLISSVASLGLGTLLMRRVAHEPSRAPLLAWGGIAIVVFSSLCIAAVVLLVAATFRTAALDVLLTTMVIGSTLFLGVQGIVQAVLIGLGRNARYAWSLAGAQLLAAAAGLAALAVGGDVHAFAGAGLLAQAVSTVVLLGTSGFRFQRAAVVPDRLRELVVGGLPFLGWNVALRVRGGLDVILTGILLQPNVAGWLVAAYRIINVPVFIPTIVTTPLLPALSASRGRPEVYKRLLGESLATVLLLTIPVSASIFALAPSIPALLGWSEPLRNAAPVMMILAFQQPLVAVDMVLGVSLVALGRERSWLRVAVAGAIFNPLLNLAVIPVAQALTGNGAMGAAVVEVTTEVLFLCGALYLTPRGLLGRDIVLRGTRTVAAGVLLVVVASVFRPSGPVIAFLAGGTAYAIAVLLLGVLRPQQLRAMRLALRTA
jgi:O-antigen/teichoic acid export membrane protein